MKRYVEETNISNKNKKKNKDKKKNKSSVTKKDYGLTENAKIIME